MKNVLPAWTLAIRAPDIHTDLDLEYEYDIEEIFEVFCGNTVLMEACDNFIIREDVIEVLLKDIPYQMRFGICKDGLSAFHMLLKECSSLKVVKLFCEDVPREYLKKVLLSETIIDEKCVDIVHWAAINGASLPVVEYLLEIMRPYMTASYLRNLFIAMCELSLMVNIDVFQYVVAQLNGCVKYFSMSICESPLYLLCCCGWETTQVPRLDLIIVLLTSGKFVGRKFIDGFNGDVLDADILACFRAVCMQRYATRDLVLIFGDLLPTYCRWSPSAFTVSTYKHTKSIPSN
eukprot:TRINITY_DN6052_c0_g1_i1.p1 TRINITY_DN6052_c0_g1~~TRINITY_DN6052_c0_g1_i1.p1  ORF type:complete len:290 (+),score=41.16 TRINITY_DN6052_c0_g1_i1:321-1190(+)